jgi:hypothetical protein
VTASINGTSNMIAVGAAGATHFAVAAPSSATAGTAFNFTVTALDQFNNPAIGYTGIVHFTSSDAQAILPANAPLSGGFGTFSATLHTSGNRTVTATDTLASSITGVSNTIVASPAAATHFSVAAPAATTAGSAFSITVTALDQFTNVATSYSGIVHFTSSDGAATLPANSTLAGGVGTFSATLATSGGQTITATDTVTPSITGTSTAVTVSTTAGPTIGMIQPNVGFTAGGQNVVIDGTNLSGAISVTFGGVPATITASSPTTILVVTPPHAPGAVDVVVHVTAGTATSTAGFLYSANIPTLSEWMLLALAAMLAGIAMLKLK